ncbi:uncharacterized protein LOC132286119 isoform X2 [Cornus florida]|uniref:uncharacterized protein LOC132286119 isoform X2 n=1 Tax=Cornus florida TaxID=4283 RepID=UPI00289F1BF8|nr:uncharacterized protein LOC132286119 isoform X2 [Cornus florida]
MGSRLGGRVIHFANLPIKLLMPSSFENIREIALKTIPSASKIEIKRVLESLYGFEVEKVRTLNMDGKKKKRGGVLFARPDYKKAYITLKNPLSISQDLYPIRVIEDEKRAKNKQSKSSFVEEGEVKSHWLDGSGNTFRPDKGYVTRRGCGSRGGDGGAGKFPSSSMRSSSSRPEKSSDGGRGGGRRGGDSGVGGVTFPWSSMRSTSSSMHSCIK